MVATFFDDNGDVAYQVEDSYRTREGAEAEGKALIQEHVKSIAEQQTKEQGQEATKQEDTPVSRGTIPTGADSAPQIIEVTDLPGGFKGDIQITPSTPDAKKPEYTTDASLVDSDGDIIDNQTTTHPSRTEAETTGRDFVSRSAEAYSSGEMPEGLEKKSSKPRKITEQELADRILNGLKHAGLIEFDLPGSVKRLDQPLDLIVEEILIMRLVTVVVGDEVNEGQPVTLYQGKQQMIEERLTVV
jgi:biotin carboxyl carrier protein